VEIKSKSELKAHRSAAQSMMMLKRTPPPTPPPKKSHRRHLSGMMTLKDIQPSCKRGQEDPGNQTITCNMTMSR